MNQQYCRIIKLPKVSDHRGSLSFIENKRHIPFEIKRVYYLYDIAYGESRGGHAHKSLQQLLIPIHGSFDVVLDDGLKKETINLNLSNCGLYLPPMIWHDLVNFSSNAVCISLTSDYYDENDYFRNYDEFLATVKEGGI